MLFEQIITSDRKLGSSSVRSRRAIGKGPGSHACRIMAHARNDDNRRYCGGATMYACIIDGRVVTIRQVFYPHLPLARHHAYPNKARRLGSDSSRAHSKYRNSGLSKSVASAPSKASPSGACAAAAASSLLLFLICSIILSPRATHTCATAQARITMQPVL